MADLRQKINQLNWLKAIGIDCYYSERSILPDHNLRRKKHNPPPLVKTVIGQDGKNKLPALNDQDSELSKNLELARQLADQSSNLDQLRQNVINFDGCELKKMSTQAVFADGNLRGPVMLIGEAPGANEDASGVPFCGESGKLLDKMLACVGISRQDNAYMTNAVFWRPPANRRPTQHEIELCRPFVEKHIYLVRPKLLILVGSVAATSLLGNNLSISKIRQEYFSYTNQYLAKPVMCAVIFHPAYLLRQPLQKKTTWQDLLRIQQLIKADFKGQSF